MSCTDFTKPDKIPKVKQVRPNYCVNCQNYANDEYIYGISHCYAVITERFISTITGLEVVYYGNTRDLRPIAPICIICPKYKRKWWKIWIR